MLNKIYRKIITLLTVVILSPYCFAADKVDSIVAIVEEDVVLRSELDTRVRTITNQLMEQGTPLPPESVMEKQVLDRLILSKLQIQMAENTGIRVDDETLNRTISSIASENELTLDQFREILEADGYTYENFREDIRNEILLSRLRQRQVDNRVFVSDREIDDFLINLQHQGGMEKEYMISHVLISLPESPTQEDLEQSRRLANKVQTELREGADIAAIAATYSDGDQALNGGDLGWLKYSQVPTLFVDFIATMEKSDISELIRSPSGYHIIKIMDIRDAEKLVVTQTLARHIFIKPNEINSEEVIKNRLLSLKSRIENGDDFSELARGNSEDVVTAADGGDLGWVSPGDLTPEFENIMNDVAINEVSDPIQEQQGWHIVQVLDRREHDGTDDIRRARAREIIRQRKMDEESELWLTQLRDDAYVEYRLE
ncbi:MAG: peptidylprolyl isomerase [Gammaproteobacteria bacterium]|jgi:peptidyl-prolyl cis-trans isomerase SurA